MTREHPEILPQWRPRAGLTQGEPRGLLDELVEEGVLTKDFIVPGWNYRVTTRIHFETDACSFRCSVTANGDELAEPPWQPLFRSLDPALAARGVEGRKELARAALETHLGVCARIGEELDHRGRLTAAGGGKRWLLPVAAAVIVLGAVAAGCWWWFSRPDTDASGQALAAIPDGPQPTLAAEPAAGREPSADGEPPAEEPLVVEGHPREVEAAAVRTPEPAPQGSPSRSARRSAGASTGTAAAPAGGRRPRTTSDPDPLPDPSPDQPVPAPAPAVEQAPPLNASGRAPAPLDVSPADHSVLTLEDGGKIYFEDGIRLVDVPSAYRGLRCVTTRDSPGDTPQGIVLTLSEPARLLVLFDQEVGRRPDWLSSFHQSGEVVSAADPAHARDLYTFLVFHKDVTAGTVALGTNTAAKVWTKKARLLTRRNTLMYLVCPAAPDRGAER